MTLWRFSFELYWKSKCVLYPVWTDCRVGRLTTDHTKKPNSHKRGNLCLYYIPLWQMPPRGKNNRPVILGRETAVNDGFWLPGTQALMSGFSLFRFHFLFYFTVSFLLWIPGFSSGCQVCTARTFSPLSQQFVFLWQFPN